MPTHPDPATVRRGDPPPPTFDYRAEAHERLREAAACLAQVLKADPYEIDRMSDLEVSILEVGGKRGALRTAERECRTRDREAREAARRNRPKRAHPTRPSVTLDAGWESFD